MPPAPGDAHLYGAPRPKSKPQHTLSSSTSSTFASHLSSLIAPSSTSTSAAARPRASKHAQKDPLFAVHNKGARKRAAADLEPSHITTPSSSAQAHSTHIGDLDSADRKRARRKMEEKARLYAAMKRGDYVDARGRPLASSDGADERGPLVDFDRKWAEREDAAGRNDGSGGESDSDGSSAGEDSDEELVEFTDDLGRTRMVPRATAAREQRRATARRMARADLAEMSARPPQRGDPDAPEGAAGAGADNLIFGDTIQPAAFAPSTATTLAMEALAAKRDRSLTPPPDTHYDAASEVRSKGVGFYAFSKDEGERRREMEGLEGMRKETEKEEAARKEKREKREREREERRKKIGELKAGREAERFLKSLG